MSAPLAALAAGTAGLLTTAAGVIAQATDSVPDLSPWLTGGGQLTLAGAAVYAFKKALDGTIVLRTVAERDREMGVMLAGMAEREERLQAVLTLSLERERVYAKKIEDSNRVLWKVTDLLESRRPAR